MVGGREAQRKKKMSLQVQDEQRRRSRHEHRLGRTASSTRQASEARCLGARMPLLQPRESEQAGSARRTAAPVYDNDELPYNYIVVIDAGSKGSRAYVYAWESAKHHLGKERKAGSEAGAWGLPRLWYEKHWHKRIKPSIESSIIDFGLHNSYLYNYLDHLVAEVYALVPVEQHYRTPVLFHATAGLRALDPDLQSKILDKICGYLADHTDFFFPDCASHVNILDGDVEGLYSWITVNYLLNGNRTAQNPASTYGVLELGGGSAQICFQPSAAETEKRSVQLVNLQLDQNYQLFSTSFLGYGLNQFHHDYLLFLIEKSSLAAAAADAAGAAEDGAYKNSGILDPCLPKEYSDTFTFNSHQYILHGSSDFQQCMDNIYSIIGDNDEQCKSLLVPDEDSTTVKVSKCMLNPIMPKFSLDKDNFIAISGYWDAVIQLLDFTNQNKDTVVSNSVVYHPEIFTETTEKICNMDFTSLQHYGGSDNHKRFSTDEITNLCFKSSYITALLHSGYGLPLNSDLDQDPDANKMANHLLINDKINGFKFSWTLGRALLYAADESAREYAKFVNGTDASLPPELRVGYYRNSAPTFFHHGSEQQGVPTRPDFELKDEYPTYTFDLKNQATKAGHAKPPATTTEQAMDYYYDFDNGYDEDEDSNFDNNGGFGDESCDDDDEAEFVYQSSNHSTAMKVFPILTLIMILLYFIPFTRNYMIRLYIKVRRSFSLYSSLGQSPDSFTFNSDVENTIGADGNLRKFHIRGGNKKNTDVQYDNNKSPTNGEDFHLEIPSAKDMRFSSSNDLELQDFKVGDFSLNPEDGTTNEPSTQDDDDRLWDVDNNLRNDVVSDFDFGVSDDEWENDSDGIERAA